MNHGRVVRAATAREWFDTLPDAFALLWDQAPTVPLDDRTALELAVTEISGNVLRHSPDPDSVAVRAYLTADARGLRAVLEDSAPGVEVDLDRPMPSTGAESGRGFAIVRACVDELEHQAGPEGNRWVLTRRARPAPAG